jgi:hypothetical protein
MYSLLCTEPAILRRARCTTAGLTRTVVQSHELHPAHRPSDQMQDPRMPKNLHAACGQLQRFLAVKYGISSMKS